MGSLKKQKEQKEQIWIDLGQFKYRQQDDRFKVRGLKEDFGFTLNRKRPGEWKLSGKDSNGNYWTNKKMIGTDLETVFEKSAEFLGFNPTAGEDPTELQIADVGEQWLDSKSKQVEDSDRQHKVALGHFLDFCDENGLRFYSELRLQHFEDYYAWVKAKFKSEWTQYHWASKIRDLVSWAARNWPDHFKRFSDGVRISQPRKSKRGSKVRIWTPETVLDFSDFLGTHPEGWKIRGVVVLCGLHSLRIKEAFRLRWDDVHTAPHLDHWYVEVWDAKGEHSDRVVKMGDEAAKVVRSLPRDEPGVTPFGKDDKDSFRGLFYRLVDEWGGADRIRPMNLRKTVYSHIMRKRKDLREKAKVAMGHAPESEMADRCYDVTTLEQELDLEQGELTSLIDQHLADCRAKVEQKLSSDEGDDIVR